MTSGNVTQLHAPSRTATRLGPREARRLADRARRAGLIGRGTPYLLLIHLFRVVDPRKGFSITLPQRTPRDQGHVQLKRRVVGLAEELGVDPESIRAANRALERSGLVLVVSGSGRSWTRYTVDAGAVARLLGALPESPWANTAVHPGESAKSETPDFLGSAPRKSGVSPQISTPQTPEKSAANARERVRVRELNPFRPIPPTPASTDRGGPPGGESPPTSGRGPLSQVERCEHGRTLAQGGCRPCGTTGRDEARRAAAQRKVDQDLERRAAQAAARADAEAERARASPTPTSFHDARRALRSDRANNNPTEEP